MKQLTLCTLTGIDDATDLNLVAGLSHRFPFAEWGVLYSRKRAGRGRYPTEARIREVISMSRECGVQVALHVCGGAVRSLLERDPAMLGLADSFHRVQINCSATDEGVSPAAIDAYIAQARRPVITQYNDVNAVLATQIKACNHEVLFDASGGRGIEGVAPAYLRNKRHCGYSGGLSPYNIEARMPEIAAAAEGRAYWIDMESSLRTGGDRFDLVMAAAALSLVNEMRGDGG